MCIAIYKPAGVPVPDDATLIRCYEANDDGAGVAYPCADGVQIVKGFKSCDEFISFVKSQDFYQTTMLLHFRIGTHGVKDGAAHTHPFPIGKSNKEMEQLVSVHDRALIHNGIMYDFGYDNEVSDTMAFCRDSAEAVLSLASVKNGKKMIESIIGYNKIAVMEKDGSVAIYGTWIFDQGIYWSNASYKPFSTAYACDPRTWGNAVNSSEFEYEDDDYIFKNGKWIHREDMFDIDGDVFFSDLIIECIEDDGVVPDAVQEKIRECASKLDVAKDSVVRPIGMTMDEWDTWVSCEFINGDISLNQLYAYTSDFRIHPEEDCDWVELDPSKEVA